MDKNYRLFLIGFVSAMIYLPTQGQAKELTCLDKRQLCEYGSTGIMCSSYFTSAQGQEACKKEGCKKGCEAEGKAGHCKGGCGW